MSFTKYTSIESFAHVYRNQKKFLNAAKVRFGAKIKLHGTNAGVRIDPDGTVTAQFRSRDLHLPDDNAGFAAWVKSTEQAWAKCVAQDVPVAVFGEWAGKGVQKGDAVCQLNQKYFFVFSIEWDGKTLTDPAEIEAILPDLDDVLVIPWDFVHEMPLDFDNAQMCEDFANAVNEDVEKIGENDPFIAGIFGVDGPGEGWVFTPMEDLTNDDAPWIDTDFYRTFLFKVKSQRHSVKKAKSVSLKVEVPENVKDFVNMFVTPARCEQGLEACGGVTDVKKTGEFLKWMGHDIKKESQVELEEAGLEWKNVSKQVNNEVKNWWLKKCKEFHNE